MSSSGHDRQNSSERNWSAFGCIATSCFSPYRLMLLPGFENAAAVGARERSVRSGFGISRIKMGDALAPHTDKRVRGDVVDLFPDAFDCRKCIAPNGAFAPLFALFLALVCSAH